MKYRQDLGQHGRRPDQVLVPAGWLEWSPWEGMKVSPNVEIVSYDASGIGLDDGIIHLNSSPYNKKLSMEATTYTAVRQNLAKTMESVCRDHAPVIVTRKQNESVVIMSLEDYEALEETAYLLRAPRNARRLLESIVELGEGNGEERSLLE